MDNEGNQPSAEQPGLQPWREIFPNLNWIAKNILRHNINTPLKRSFNIGNINCRLESEKIDTSFTLRLKRSVSTANGLALEWLTGDMTRYLEVEFTISRLGVTAYGTPISGEDPVKLSLLAEENSARNLEEIAKQVLYARDIS